MTKKLRNILIGTLIFSCLLLLFFSVKHVVFSSEKKQWSFSEVEIKKTYAIGDAFNVPKCDFYLNGTRYDTAYYMILPNKTSIVKDSFSLTESGNYKLVYTGKADGISRSVSYEFSVLHALYGIDGDSDSLFPYYGVKDFNGNEYSGQEGIFTRLKNMDTFYIKQILDISTYTKNDTVIKFFNIPQKLGENDANLILRLTDVENENNFVEVEFKTVLDESNILTYYNTYITGRFTDSDVIGASLRPAQSATGEYIPYRGQWFSVQKNNSWGHETVFSWVGTPQNKQLGDESVSISYDYADNAIFANGMLVVDLDDPAFYEKGFGGFSSGRVKLTLEGKKYSKAYADLCILQIADMDLSKNVFYDVDAPKISIDTKGNVEIPKAVVGEKYNIFDCSAYDEVDGYCETEVSVYKNYYMKGKTIVDSTNGYFIPKTAGNYYVVYKSKDLSGNTAEVVVNVNAIKERVTPLSVTLDENTFPGEVGNELQAFSNVSVKGNIGNYKISAYAVHNGTNKSFDIIDGKFLPLYIGTYSVFVKVSDYIGSADYETFTVEVTGDSEGVIRFYDEYHFDKYFIKNASYKINDYYAYKLTASSVEKVLTKVYVNEDGKGFDKLISGNTYLVGASNTVQFRYEYNGSYIDSAVYKVFDVNFGSQNVYVAENFFNTSNIVKTASEKGVSFTVEDKTADSCIEFINSVQVREFSLLFSLSDTQKSFGKLKIRLCDVYDENNDIIIYYYLKNDGAYFSYNNKEVKLHKSFGSEEVEYSLQFNNETLMLNDEKLSFYNSDFMGFTDCLAYLSLSFEGVDGTAGVKINQINGQDFKSGMTDNRAPQIFVDKRSVNVPYKSEVKVREAVVKDVLDPCPVFTFQVTTPSGSFAKTKDGVTLDGDKYSLDYIIVLDSYGYYNFSYKATDICGNGQTRLDIKTFNCNSVDVTPPVLTVSKISSTANVNDKIALPTISATDETGCEVKIDVILIDADGISKMMKENSFVANKAGKYTIIVTAIDEAGNYSSEQVIIEVR